MSIYYKYRDWSEDNHKRILTKGEIYISSPLSLNDPFDCQLTENLNLLDSDLKINQFIELQIDILGLPKYGKETELLKKSLYDRLINERDVIQKEIDKFSIERLDKYIGVFSLSCNWNSILMWGHYSRSHSGFCIGFDSEYLDSCKIFSKGGLISYSQSYPQIDPNLDNLVELSFLQTHTKSDLWKYEEEYRYTKVYEKPPSKTERVEKIDMRCIKEIIIGLNFPDKEIEIVKEIAKRNNIELYKAIKEPFKFAIDREKIAYT